MKRYLFLLLVLALFPFLQAQTNVNMGSQASVTGCDFFIYDNGGPTGDYAANSNDTLRIISNNGALRSVRVEVLSMAINAGDTLYIYNGSTSDSLLGIIHAGNYSPEGIYIFTSTIQNQSGAITLHFVSDTVRGEGFKIQTSCVKPCQRVGVVIDSLLSSHIPAFDPNEDDGYMYVNVCPYDTLQLVVKGIYPDNNYSYFQSDNTTEFKWDFSDTTVQSIGMTSFRKDFIIGRGYNLAITAKDVDGCETVYAYSFRIRTSANPISSVSPFPNYCTGDEIPLKMGYDLFANFRLDSIGSEQASALTVTDTVFLPDGADCPPYGTSYRSPVTFTSFSNNAQITNVDDILYLRINMEHSFQGDIRIMLYCPNGSSTVVHPDQYGPYKPRAYESTNVSSSFFGDPNHNDNSSNKCSAALNLPGTGWNYVWSENTTRGYVYAASAGSRVYESANHIPNPANPNYGNQSGKSIDSTNVANMTQVYKPERSFSSLIGCPLNGTWYVEVTDTWGIDNGYVFEWELALNEKLLPQNWSYKVEVDSMYITGPGAGEGYVIPEIPGDIDYIVTIVDEFGCEYDTNFMIHAVASPQPDLGGDLITCVGNMLELDATFDDPTASYFWNTGDRDAVISVVSAGKYIVTVTTYNADSSLVCKGQDTVVVDFLETPSVDFHASTTASCSPLSIKLYDDSRLILSAPGHVSPLDSMAVTFSQEWRIINSEGDQVFSSALESPEVTLTDGGQYHVQLIITTSEGCRDSLTKWNYLEVYPQPLSEFQADPEISLMSENGGVVKFINYTDSIMASEDGVSWYWDFGDGTIDSSALSPVHTYSTWGDYTVTFYITTQDGCMDEISHIVVIESDLEFPNIITPNGDGYNDVFAIKNLNTSRNSDDPDNFRNNLIHIYDRWGKLIYKAENYDTYMKDEELVIGKHYFDGSGFPDGVYYFTFYYKGKKKTVTYNGTITIIR